MADPGAVPGFDETWAVAESHAPYFTGNLSDYRANATGGDARIAIRETAEGGRLILPFRKVPLTHKFTIGERKIGQMTFSGLRLANPWYAEGHAPEEIAALLGDLLQGEGVDAIELGEIPENSDLRRALENLPPATRRLALGRKNSLRWLIHFTGDFETYLGGLSKGTRQSLRRKMRKLDQRFETRLEIVSEAREVARFLEEGERISRLTYQWHVGQRLVNDDQTAGRYQTLARAGRLHCYLLTLDGTPRAFLRGTFEGNLYHFETPGFDPAYGQYSVGHVLLLRVLQDLMENTEAEAFDFGTGGDESGYKASFGTDQVVCNSWLVVRRASRSGLALLAAEATLCGTKNTADRIIPRGKTRDTIKRWLRKYGA